MTLGRTNLLPVDSLARGSLSWDRLRLDPATEARLVPSTSRVWLAPRAVSATPVVDARTGQAEKYLFYRGVGNLDAPLIVRQQAGTLEVSLREGDKHFKKLPRLWLVDVASDGHVRLSTRDAKGRMAEFTNLPERRPGDASSLAQLQGELRAALTAEGLYPDEADAMLETWRLSYFESEGLRLFFTLPRAWIDAWLPLEISVPSDITRVMVGRIELVSPTQRALMTELASLPGEAFPPQRLYYQDPAVLAISRAGARSHADLYRATERAVPRALELYESLGRFRDALLAHESKTAGGGVKVANLDRALREFGACVGALAGPATEAVLTTKQ